MGDNKELNALDYELFLLATMVNAPSDLVDQALGRIGLDREAMASSHRRIEQENFIMRPAFDDISALFGTPLRVEQRYVDGQNMMVRIFPLRLWSDFDLEIYGSPDGMVWTEAFSRADASSTPRIEYPSELRPWLLTKDEVQDNFGPLRELEVWPPSARYAFDHRTPDGKAHSYIVDFSRSLLQAVRINGSTTPE